MTTVYSREEVLKHDSVKDAWVIVDQRVFDVTSFLYTHPGGLSITEEYLGRDISSLLRSEDVHRHSQTAFEVLEQYCIGRLAEYKEQQIKHSGYKWKEEELVDWSKPMLWQVARVGLLYKEWVHTPVHRPLRLFHSDYIELLTKCPWWVIPILWIPFAFYMCSLALSGAFPLLPWLSADSPISPIMLVALLPLGVLLWTLIEYLLHRFVFHLDPPPKSPWWITFHFVIHGLHHKVPFDQMRLVFPPVPASIIMFFIYVPGIHILPLNIGRALFAGGLLGYVFYDLTHYYLHHGSPKPGSYFASLKTYHVAHHYIDYNLGFGISSKLWDIPFGTLLKVTSDDAKDLSNK